MENKKAALMTATVVIAIILAGGGFWLGQKHSKKIANLDAQTAANDNSGSSISTSTADSTGGLSVSSGSGATSLGQLGGSSADGSGTGGQSTSGSSSSSSSSSSAVDPSTFSQYDKYKNNTTALFGDITVGSGATLGVNQKATITYKGWLTDGTSFDESQTNSSGQLVPLSFTLGSHQVITGMEEGVDGMKVGGERLIIVPPSLGYGDSGQGSIPGGAVLIFDVKLLDVQ